MSEVNIKDIDNKLFRLESEFYQSKYTDLDDIIRSFENLGNISKRIECGPFGSNLLDTEYSDEGILVVRPFNLKNSTVEKDNLVYISEKLVKQNNLKIYPINTLLFSRVGDIKVGVLNREKSTISPNIIAVEFNDADFSKFFAIFFKTKYGFLQLERQLKISAQPTISTGIIKDLKVPLLDIYPVIVKLFDDSQSILKKSQQKYAEAETLLLENLGLQNFQANSEPVNIKSLKESFLKTGRLDAEYYQPIYELLENHIFSHSHGFEKLGNICRLNDENYTPKDNQEYDYIELSNIGKSGEITDSTRALGKDLPSRARRKVQTNDVMISSIEGSLQSCAIVSPQYDNALCSTGFYVLSSDKINAETLLVLFKSSLMQQILKKNCSGTILTAINKDELLNICLPIVDEKIQLQIAEYVRQSNELREQATQLLAQAKSNVELEIENNSFNINELEFEGGGLSLLEKSAYFIRLAEWTLLESLIFAQKTNVSIRSLSQSFGLSGRLDAEYYHPKFERLLHKLKQQNCKTLGELVDLQKSVEVGSENYRDEGLPFVRVADFSKFGIGQTNKFVNPADYTDIIRPKKDTILLSKDGTVGIAYRVPSDMEVITSGAIVHLSLKTDEILPDYLALVLNSKAVQLQAERDAGGSIIQHWKPSEILEVVIPILPKDIQKMIADKVQMSFELKNQSENLLAQAKILVENEIESI